MIDALLYGLGTLAGLWLLRRIHVRLRLSRAKHPSLRGHAKLSQRFARLLPFYEYDEAQAFACDGAPAEVAARRRIGFHDLANELRAKAPRTLEASTGLAHSVSDVEFTDAYRVPFQFRNLVRSNIRLGAVMASSHGNRLTDLDGNESLDLAGSYGCNVFGYELSKRWIDRAVERARDLGPVLGPYHPVLAENVAWLREISGLDEVSFHMSGTEAVMQAVRLARYHTRKSHVVRLCGAYHGWWDGVQAGVGNPRPPHEVYTLKDMDEATLRVLRTRTDIACVLVNPLQALHPNGNAPGDSMLVASDRQARFDRAAYAAWLRELRAVCTERDIPLIFDEVFLGFRLAYRGAQEYFGVQADLVTYGKTLGGGLPVGAVCGAPRWMKRYRDDRPTDICFARGTFNSHPYVMTAMNEFLRHVRSEAAQNGYAYVDAVWDARAHRLNDAMQTRDLPVRVANMTSVFTTLYTVPNRFNWMYQFYLRAEGLALSWIGTGRFIFSHDYTDADFDEVVRRAVAAAEKMRDDGFFWSSPELTDKAIKRGVLRELLRARFGSVGSAEGRV